LLKKALQSIEDLFTEVSWDCSVTGITIQAMDNSHTSLVSVSLNADGFDKFRCDSPLSMGMNLGSLLKIMRLAVDDDIITIKMQDNADTVTFTFESPTRCPMMVSELKNLDQERLAIPETDYACTVKMPAGEFQRIVKDLGRFDESLEIACTKERVQFSAAGDIGTTNTELVQSTSSDNEDEAVTIDVQEPVTLTVACSFLSMVAKAGCLAPQVTLSMSHDLPLVMEYKTGFGHIRYYLTSTSRTSEDQQSLSTSALAKRYVNWLVKLSAACLSTVVNILIARLMMRKLPR
jgi:proliferating cell nuclear antigen